MLTTKALVEALDLERLAVDRYRAGNVEAGHGVVFGGQLMAQSIAAGLIGHDDKAVKTLHTVFARGASPDAEVEISVDPMHRGRTFASSTVTIAQGDRLCARSSVLLSAGEPDLIRHSLAAPDVPPADECPPAGEPGADWEVRVVGGVDVSDPAAVGPPELDVWTRFRGAPVDPRVDQALLAFATDGFLIGTAMRPHEGIGQAQAHRTIATGVVSHTITFHEPCPAGDWVLLSHRSVYAGGGRGYGRADVFSPDGRLVASFVQDAMIRPMPPGA